MTKYSNNDLTLFSRVLFEQALKDINAALAPSRHLSEPDEVSFASFRQYISEHHSMVHREQSIEQLSMILYKKAIDDIAFQASIFGFLLREIPIAAQRTSCEFAVSYLKEQVRTLDSDQTTSKRYNSGIA
jgi:hypothetical protein